MDDEEEEEEFRHLTFDPHHVIFVLQMTSVTLALTAVGCTGCGIWTMIYAAPKLNWPYSSGSGVWTGVIALITGCLGTGSLFRLDLIRPERTKKYIISFYLCVICTFFLGILHVILSSFGLSYCKNEVLSFEIYCNREDRGRLMFISCMDIGFGIAIIIVSFCTILYVYIGRKLRVLIGSPRTQRFAVEHDCFFHMCVCYIS